MRSLNEPISFLTQVLSNMGLLAADHPPRYTNDKRNFVQACILGTWRLFSTTYLECASELLVRGRIEEMTDGGDGIPPF